MATNVIDLPQRERQPRAAKIGKPLGAVQKPKAELVSIETDRTLDIGAQNADVADRVPLGKSISVLNSRAIRRTRSSEFRRAPAR